MKRMRHVPIARVVAGIACAIAAVTLASACADEEILLAKLPPGFDAGAGGSLRCVDETGCAATEFCSRGQCFDVGGACETRPRFCTEDAVPVCGCDGITYWNDCFRKTAGVSAMTPGECTSGARKCGVGGGPHGGPPGGDDRCPAGVFCARLLPAHPRGRCLPCVPSTSPGPAGRSRRCVLRARTPIGGSAASQVARRA